MKRERHVAIWLRMLAEKEIYLARASKNLFKAQATRIARAFQEGGQYEASQAVEKGEEEWIRVFVAVYSTTIRYFSEYIQEILTGKKSKNRFLDRAKTFISTQAYMKSKYVTKTSHEIVKRVITDGLEKGLSESQIAKNLKQDFGADSASGRSRMIARTEVHNAASYGMQNGAEETELPLLMREWVSVFDERTRDDHAEADGQKREMDEPFLIGDEEVDYPGDGSPENAINCRCTLIYEPSDTSFSGDPGGDFISD